MEAVVHAVDQVGQVVDKVPGEVELEGGQWEEGEKEEKGGTNFVFNDTVVQYCSMRLFNISDQGETDLCIEELAASMHNRYSFLAWEDNHDFITLEIRL